MGSPKRTPRPRGTLGFTKPALSPDELLELLVERGLTVPDSSRAARYLRHIGYYRLSPYTIPFQQDRTGHLLRAGTAFDDILDLYIFDRSLRLLVMDALERVEVAARAALTDHMSTTYSTPHWYTETSHFKNLGTHRRLIEMVRKTVRDQLRAAPEAAEYEPGTARDEDVAPDAGLVHRSALEHYLTTYGEPELPPCWLVVETLTIGQLSSMYRNLRRRADRTAVAQSLGLTAPVLESWLQTYVRVRNICAHHGRLWNVGLGVYPAIPTSASVAWLANPAALPTRSVRRLYPVLVSLQSVLKTISPRSGWASRLRALVEPRPQMNLLGMGVPEGWSDDEFWMPHLA